MYVKKTLHQHEIIRPDRQWRSSSFQESKKVHVSRDLWPWPWAHPGCRLTWRPSCASLVAIQPFAWEKKQFSCQHKSARITWPLTLTLTLSTPWWPSCASLVAIQPFAWEKKRFLFQHKSARITWPLTLTLSTPWMQADLESILWTFGGNPAICVREEAICAKVYRRTDGQTDDGCRAIALTHSWNELKTASNLFNVV